MGSTLRKTIHTIHKKPFKYINTHTLKIMSTATTIRIARTLGRRLTAAKTKLNLEDQILTVKPAKYLEDLKRFAPITTELHKIDRQFKLHNSKASIPVQREHVDTAMHMDALNKQLPFNIFK